MTLAAAGGAGRSGEARRGGRVRAGAEGRRVLGAHGVRPGRHVRGSGASRPRGARRAGCGPCWTARARSLSPAARRSRRSSSWGCAATAATRRRGTGVGVRGAVSATRTRPWGLDMALKVHGLAVHSQDGYDEWGVSGQLRLVPGGSGRGLSASLTPSWGVDPSGSERLWAEPASSGLAATGEAEPSSRLDGEVGYGMALWGRPLHGHAQCRVRDVGGGARVPHGLAPDLGGPERSRLRDRSRRHPAGSGERQRGRTRGDAEKPDALVGARGQPEPARPLRVRQGAMTAGDAGEDAATRAIVLAGFPVREVPAADRRRPVRRGPCGAGLARRQLDAGDR